MHSKTKSKEKMKVRHTSGFQQYFRLNLNRNLTRYTRGEILCRNTSGFRAEKPTSGFQIPTGSRKLYLYVFRYYSPSRKVKERTNGKGKIWEWSKSSISKGKNLKSNCPDFSFKFYLWFLGSTFGKWVGSNRR